MRVVASLYLPSVEQMLEDCGLNEGGEVQKTIDQFVLSQSEPYIPHRNGQLIVSGSKATKIGSGEVIWNTPYAHYMYEGRLMVSPTTGSSWARKDEQKIYANPPQTLKYHGGELRGDHWFDRMMIDKKDELIEECQKVINRRLK